MISLYLLDHARQPVAGAEVYVDGRDARYDALYDQYCLDIPRPERSHIEIRHPDFEPLVYEKFPWLSNRLYLLQPNDLFCYSNGVKVATLPYPGLILVAMQPSAPDSDRQRDPRAARAVLQRLCESHGLKIRHGGGDRNAEHHADPYCYVYVLAREDGRPMAAQDSDLLASLRRAADVQYAGPLLTHTEDFSELMGLSHYVIVTFRADVDEAAARLRLGRHGLKAEPNIAFRDASYLRVPLDPSIGRKAADIAGMLYALPEVMTADNEVIAFIR